MKKNNVLIADDNDFIRESITHFLDNKVAHLDAVIDGEAAIEKLKENQYQLILLDVNMPKKNGFDVLKEIKKMEIKTPVIVFSSMSDDKSKELALSLGAKEYFVKSDLDLAHLSGVVHVYLHK